MLLHLLHPRLHPKREAPDQRTYCYHQPHGCHAVTTRCARIPKHNVLFSKGQSKESSEATTICVMSAGEPTNPPGISKTLARRFPLVATRFRRRRCAKEVDPCEPYLTLSAFAGFRWTTGTRRPEIPVKSRAFNADHWRLLTVRSWPPDLLQCPSILRIWLSVSH